MGRVVMCHAVNTVLETAHPATISMVPVTLGAIQVAMLLYVCKVRLNNKNKKKDF